MALQQFRRPALPIAQHLIKYTLFKGRAIRSSRQPHQQFRSARRRSRARIEHGDLNLASRERRVDNRDIPDHYAQKREAHSRFEHRERARSFRGWKDVAVAQSKEGLTALIQQSPERHRLIAKLEMLPQAKLQQGKTQNQPSRPNKQQQDQRQGPEVSQKVLLSRRRMNMSRDLLPRHPSPPVKPCGEPEMAGSPPRQHYGFKGIQQDHGDDDESNDAGEDIAVVIHVPLRS